MREVPRILYLARNYGRAVGGTKIAYHHVDALVKAGYNAMILLTSEKPDDWQRVVVPVLNVRAYQPVATDSVVYPEGWRDVMSRTRSWNVRKYCFVQNHHYVFAGISNGQNYSAYGIERIFCCGRTIQKFLESQLGFADVACIQNGIDLSLFRPLGKTMQIAYMPRKRQIEAVYIRELFRRRHPHLRHLNWLAIDGYKEEMVARTLGESAFFVALSKLEGSPLPPLEAMAAGCLVCGFTGKGAADYATAENGFWIADEDLDGVVEVLGSIVRQVTEAPLALAHVIAAGRDTALRRSIEQMSKCVVDYWEAELRSLSGNHFL